MFRGLLVVILFSFASLELSAKDIMKSSQRSIASMKQSIRVVHAKELLGSAYEKSFIKNFSQKSEMDAYVYKFVLNALPKKFKSKAKQISQTIIDEAFRQELDPYFLMAVIAGESSFNPKAKGPVGETGLMQLRDSTGKWIAKMLKIKWNPNKTLEDPILNIKIGAKYLAWLRNKFNGHSQLYLAAYNMGPGNVKDALDRNKWPKDYPIHVMKRYFSYYEVIQNEIMNSIEENLELFSSLHLENETEI